MIEITCSKFFDGEKMHGPTLITLSQDHVVVDIVDYEGTPVYYLVSPGLFDL